MIDQQLIEKALALTGKTMEDMHDIRYDYEIYRYYTDFSIEKFCYYLLSPEFIARYSEQVERGYDTNDIDYELIKEFSLAIYKYQKNNPKPLISLLKKIG